jgi:hypothetical protein
MALAIAATPRNSPVPGRWLTTGDTPGQAAAAAARDDAGSATVLPNESTLALLADVYDLEPHHQVRAFVAKHDFLVLTLLAARSHCLDATNGRTRRLLLTWSRDPEDDGEGLTVEAITDLSVQRALAAMDQIDHDWWLGTDHRVRSLITILVRPG